MSHFVTIKMRFHDVVGELSFYDDLRLVNDTDTMHMIEPATVVNIVKLFLH